MTILALRTSRHANGVSKLHGHVSQGLWKHVWDGVPEDEVPITSVTNGIHTKTWMAPDFVRLYDRYMPDWEEHLTDRDFWRKVQDIPDEEIWNTHQNQKRRTIDFIRARTRDQWVRLGETPERLRAIPAMLNPEVLTIGFARRFATYKRATLLFSDIERLKRLLNNADRPVQFVRRKGAPEGRAGEAVHPGRVSLQPDAGIRGAHRLHRGLRSLRRPPPLSGRGPLAEQSAPPARSERHKRHEIATERRTEPQRPRRLVV